jgi:hypothetical protein
MDDPYSDLTTNLFYLLLSPEVKIVRILSTADYLPFWAVGIAITIGSFIWLSPTLLLFAEEKSNKTGGI